MRWSIPTLALIPTAIQAAEVCIEAANVTTDPDAPAALVRVHEEVVDTLQRFPTLLAALEERAPAFCLADDLDNAHGYLDVEQNRIYLSDQLPYAMLLGVLLHEIRHLEQSAVGICPSDDLAMKEYARATLALEADASAVSLLVAWDMKENGNSGPWTALSAWPNQSDIASAFATEMLTTGDIASAVSDAFEQWFRSEDRREEYYITACSDFLDRQDASHSLPRYQLISADFFDSLCRLPDGSAYQCKLDEVEQR